MLCLCPNDHVRLDTGAIFIDPTFQVIDALTRTPLGPLRTVDTHQINAESVRYHRQLFAGWPPTERQH